MNTISKQLRQNEGVKVKGKDLIIKAQTRWARWTMFCEFDYQSSRQG
jgi:hypothetical protein